MINTILHRPYVFIFLLTFLILARIYWGNWKKPILWLVIGYIVAWASEVSSINNGFPYGLYHYIYENMPGELMVAGVPFWDSLSYPFMIFAGYTTAEFILGVSFPRTRESHLRAWDSCFRRNDILAALFGAFLTMLLDIIIDPLTVRGSQWFLGNIYYYPNGGQYFGVPLTNFAGWFLVPLVVIWIFQLINRIIPPPPPLEKGGWGGFQLMHFLNPLFYLSIALFNIAITIWINEPLLASIDCFLLVPIVGLITYKIKHR